MLEEGLTHESSSSRQTRSRLGRLVCARVRLFRMKYPPHDVKKSSTHTHHIPMTTTTTRQVYATIAKKSKANGGLQVADTISHLQAIEDPQMKSIETTLGLYYGQL